MREHFNYLFYPMSEFEAGFVVPVGVGVGASVGSAAIAGVAVKCGVYAGVTDSCIVGAGVPGAAVSSGISIISIICTSALKLPVCDTAMQPANASMDTNINMPAACLIIE